MVSVGKTADGNKVYAVAKESAWGGHGGYAVKMGDEYFQSDKDGNMVLGENGKPKAVKESRLRGGVMSIAQVERIP